jgi:hypothetical protein
MWEMMGAVVSTDARLAFVSGDARLEGAFFDFIAGNESPLSGMGWQYTRLFPLGIRPLTGDRMRLVSMPRIELSIMHRGF